MRQLRQIKRAGSTSSGSYSTFGINSSESELGASGILSVLERTTDMLKGKELLPAVSHRNQTSGALEKLFHQTKLQKVKAGVDRRSLTSGLVLRRTDSSSPVRPSWHHSQKGNLTKAHNTKLMPEAWRHEQIQREKRTAALKPLWADTGPKIKKP